MNKQQNEVPAWAKGDGWTRQSSSKNDQITAFKGDVSIHAGSDGTATMYFRYDEVEVPTPEIAREVADFILSRVVK